MNEQKDLTHQNSDGKQWVHMDALTDAEVEVICTDLLAKAKAHLAQAEEVRRYWESLEPEVKMICADLRAEAETIRADLLAKAEGHKAHAEELRRYWDSKHSGQGDLLP